MHLAEKSAVYVDAQLYFTDYEKALPWHPGRPKRVDDGDRNFTDFELRFL